MSDFSADDVNDGSDGMGPANRWIVLFLMSAALLLVIIDMTVLYIAIPSIATDLDPTSTQLLWIIDIYPLVSAPLLVAVGALGDRFGRKLMLLLGLIVFTVASAFAAFAWSPEALIFARAIQGVGGALIMPSTTSMIRAVFPDRSERVRAVGIWSATLAASAAAGPLLGGLLVEHFSWGAVFLINVPIMLVLLPFAIKILPESRSSDPPPWDTASLLAVAGGVLTLAWSIKHLARDGLAEPITFIPMIISVVLLTTFARRQLAADRPMLDLRLLQRPEFAVAIASLVLVMFAFAGLELYFTQYLQLVLGLSPVQASLRLLPLVIATVAGSLLAARLLKLVGSRNAMVYGLGVSAIGMLPLLALGRTDQILLLSVPFMCIGFFLQIAMVAANDTILSSVSADDAGQAAAFEATAYDFGGGIGIAVIGALGAAVYTRTFPSMSGLATGDHNNASGSISTAVELAKDLPGQLGDRLLGVAQDTFITSFHVVTAVAIALMVISAVIAAIALPRGTPGTEPGDYGH